MSNDKELREAAEWYTDEGRHFPWNEHARTLAEWAVAELSRRDAEAAERAKPITEVALLARGFVPEHDLAWHSGRISVRQYAQHVHGDVESTILLDDNEITWRATIGQLDDLIAALKGGGV